MRRYHFIAGNTYCELLDNPYREWDEFYARQNPTGLEKEVG